MWWCVCVVGFTQTHTKPTWINTNEQRRVIAARGVKKKKKEESAVTVFVRVRELWVQLSKSGERSSSSRYEKPFRA